MRDEIGTEEDFRKVCVANVFDKARESNISAVKFHDLHGVEESRTGTGCTDRLRDRIDLVAIGWHEKRQTRQGFQRGKVERSVGRDGIRSHDHRKILQGVGRANSRTQSRQKRTLVGNRLDPPEINSLEPADQIEIEDGDDQECDRQNASAPASQNQPQPREGGEYRPSPLEFLLVDRSSPFGKHGARNRLEVKPLTGQRLADDFEL